MNPAEVVERLQSLNWSGVPVEHQLAASAAVETLRAAPMTAQEAAIGLAFRQDGKPVDIENVVTFPAPKREQSMLWRRIVRLDGTLFAMAGFIGPDSPWSWIVDTITTELGCHEDQIGCMEPHEDEGGGDYVTVDGVPVFRVLSGLA